MGGGSVRILSLTARLYALLDVCGLPQRMRDCNKWLINNELYEDSSHAQQAMVIECVFSCSLVSCFERTNFLRSVHSLLFFLLLSTHWCSNVYPGLPAKFLFSKLTFYSFSFQFPSKSLSCGAYFVCCQFSFHFLLSPVLVLFSNSHVMFVSVSLLIKFTCI